MRNTILLLFLFFIINKVQSQNIFFKNKALLESALLNAWKYDSIYPTLHSRIYNPRKIKRDQKVIKFVNYVLDSNLILTKKEARKHFGFFYEIRKERYSSKYIISISGHSYIRATIIYDTTNNVKIYIFLNDWIKNMDLLNYVDGTELNYIYPINYLLPFIKYEVQLSDEHTFFILEKKLAPH